MCRGKDEPGGPVRCSHHMGEALRATQAKYAGIVTKLSQFKSDVAQDKEYAAKLEEYAQTTRKGRQHIKIEEIEKIEASIKKSENLIRNLEQREQTWRAKLKQSQMNFDSTRGGLSRLSDEYNQTNKQLSYLKEHEEDTIEQIALSNPDMNDEEVEASYKKSIANLEERKRRLKTRITKAEDTLTEERAWRVGKTKAELEEEESNGKPGRPKSEDEEEEEPVQREKKPEEEEEPAPERSKAEDEEEESSEREPAQEEEEEVTYHVVDNSEDGEDTPSGDDSDALLDDDISKEFDRIIDELDLSAINVDYGAQVDPETGETFNQSEIEAYSRKMRREARARVRRQAMADGDTKEILRAFLRTAVYRALRYNKSTRKITRLIGISQFNAVIDKIDDINSNKKDKRLSKAKEKWRARRQSVADEELKTLEAQQEKDESKHAARMEKIDHLKERGKLSDTEYNHFKKTYDDELKKHLGQIQYERNVISRMKIEWHEEEAVELENKEKRDEEIRQAMIASERQRKEVNDFMTQNS